ncbi:hypothetical protein E2C01_007785 [Portunus trituberculatus]|uniref:Uncharacterized protein n=1 Tax=Portunus trituberculatus TaxID=210409 RepID=A0A5B7D4T2_PORTR|nr:hypothetical protein [Portunus trituberculatus]
MKFFSAHSYNVPFGGGLPAPVLPVRNNLRHSVPGTGPRGGGGPSSGTSRGPSNPHCSWRCTAIIFITIAVHWFRQQMHHYLSPRPDLRAAHKDEQMTREDGGVRRCSVEQDLYG